MLWFTDIGWRRDVSHISLIFSDVTSFVKQVDFPLPIVACNLMIEYSDFYENFQVNYTDYTNNLIIKLRP